MFIDNDKKDSSYTIRMDKDLKKQALSIGPDVIRDVIKIMANSEDDTDILIFLKEKELTDMEDIYQDNVNSIENARKQIKTLKQKINELTSNNQDITEIKQTLNIELQELQDLRINQKKECKHMLQKR